MPRRRRNLVAGATYHVFTRGNHRRAVFHDDEDRAWFMRRLERVEDRCGVLHFAHCLMANHLHLVVRPEDRSLSVLMHRLLGSYAQWFNLRHGAVGHVFHGRFGSRPLESDFDLLTVIRYVHRNPVEAGMARSAASWKWSSHREYLASRPASRMERAVRTVRSLLDPDPERATNAYRRMVRVSNREETPVPVMLHGPGIRGSRGPNPAMPPPRTPITLESVAQEIARTHGVEVADLKARHGPRELALPRRAFCRVAVRELGFSAKETSSFLGRVPSAVTNILQR